MTEQCNTLLFMLCSLHFMKKKLLQPTQKKRDYLTSAAQTIIGHDDEGGMLSENILIAKDLHQPSSPMLNHFAQELTSRQPQEQDEEGEDD